MEEEKKLIEDGMEDLGYNELVRLNGGSRFTYDLGHSCYEILHPEPKEYSHPNPECVSL